MYTLTHHAYCGMTLPILEDAERSEVRAEAARRLRIMRRHYPVAILERGREWEVLEPENCAMIPDACGVLSIRHDTFDCRECGFGRDTRDAAAECCT